MKRRRGGRSRRGWERRRRGEGGGGEKASFLKGIGKESRGKKESFIKLGASSSNFCCKGWFFRAARQHTRAAKQQHTRTARKHTHKEKAAEEEEKKRFLLPQRVCCPWLCAMPVQHMKAPEQAREDTSPRKIE